MKAIYICFILQSDPVIPLIPAGNEVEKLFYLCNIIVNKHPVFGDSNPLAPGGVRIGKAVYPYEKLILNKTAITIY